MQNVKYLLFLFAILLLNACSEDEHEDIESSALIGKWQLIEQLVDPGDGSGVFVPVNSDKTIEFFNNESWKSNGSLCSMNAALGQTSEGIYTSTAGMITIENCGSGQLTINYRLENYYRLENRYLILNYLCDESCQQKFTRIK